MVFGTSELKKVINLAFASDERELSLSIRNFPGRGQGVGNGVMAGGRLAGTTAGIALNRRHLGSYTGFTS
jgi:hypothetical protein